MVIGAGFLFRILAPYGMDPTIFVSFGDDSAVQREYIHSHLGTVSTRPRYVPDGKFFFVQANDPWILAPEENAAFLDRPIYRSQRMLYPLLAGGLGLFAPMTIVWAMLVINVVSVGLGAGFAAALASTWGRPTWLGLFVPLNLGFLFELEIGGSAILAYALCLGGLIALERRHSAGAAALFAAAALTREVMIIFPVGLILLSLMQKRRPTWQIVVIPALAIVLWNLYLHLRLTGIDGTGVVWGAFSLPFYGIVQAFGQWLDHPQLLLNVLIVVMIAVFVSLASRSDSPIAWGALPFAALAIVLSQNVWRETHDITRAIAPIFTAIPFLVVSSRSDDPEGRERPRIADVTS